MATYSMVLAIGCQLDSSSLKNEIAGYARKKKERRRTQTSRTNNTDLENAHTK
ncbi:hypothetical protein M413DRAFT_443217 [Hebeloma cylindrosporum]|uniref:Uncharacterized protein n=1 Tax=Hebeloma cylindrosporum TaxID=76867 RepID=A0A0C3CJC1_HEBCY|nr:hypothetical protein M413DRAFT_443217 [Hebeloma cylindrosporum h7]